MRTKREFFLIAPFAAWMLLMAALPSQPWAYALRTVVTALLLLPGLRAAGLKPGDFTGRELLWGTVAGLAVIALWIYPEQFAFYRRWCIFGASANAPVDVSAWPWKVMRLLGSAFVIAVAEELFFRKWLIAFAGLGWAIVLFAIEHDRWLVAAIAGVIFTLLAVRRGLAAAIIAHVVANLALGLWVLATGQWQFW